MNELTIGYALTGSFCTLESMIKQIQMLKDNGAKIIPIVSSSVASTDTRFGTAEHFKQKIVEICGVEPLDTIEKTEPIGPKSLLDALIIAPCTGNTLAKIANGITDTSVTMAAKAHLRNKRPLILAIATNDGLSGNAKNIGQLLVMKNVYFVPFGQDDCVKKSASLISQSTLIPDTLEYALKGEQIQPILYSW
ncbi:MAG: dipicolinate synthase subunit [Clostridiales bacterium]|jgi:dipicolinate synthase subunit B|nr:dipicolinate synthase subunit [Clostridiales bacterium]